MSTLENEVETAQISTKGLSIIGVVNFALLPIAKIFLHQVLCQRLVILGVRGFAVGAIAWIQKWS